MFSDLRYDLCEITGCDSCNHTGPFDVQCDCTELNDVQDDCTGELVKALHRRE